MSRIWEVFITFLRLGMTSFGGPTVHIGVYQRYLVQEKKWLSATRFAELLAFANFLPGPTSSQVGFSIGIERAGLAGGIAAQLGFLIPSFVLMLVFYYFGMAYFESTAVINVISALKVFAVAVVFDAILTMAKQFMTKLWQQGVALAICILIILGLPFALQLLCLLMAALIGWLINGRASFIGVEFKALRKKPLIIFIGLLLFSFVVPTLFGDFYKVGSLVFGGAHVVLPLMHELAAPQMDQDVFIAGYGLAQAIPGPLFTLATFIAANLRPEHAFLAAAIATFAIFLPGNLLVWAFFSTWKSLAQNNGVQSLLSGVNAAVVGLLAAAFINPIIIESIHQVSDALLAVIAIIALKVLKLRVSWVLLLVVVLYGAMSILL